MKVWIARDSEEKGANLWWCKRKPQLGADGLWVCGQGTRKLPKETFSTIQPGERYAADETRYALTLKEKV